MTTRQAARRWALAWEAAWRRHDPDLVRAVYAEDCPRPFRDPYVGIDGVLVYAPGVRERAVHRAVVRRVARRRSLVEYRAFVVDHDGVQETIAGCAALRFDRDGRVTEERGLLGGRGGHLRPPESGAHS